MVLATRTIAVTAREDMQTDDGMGEMADPAAGRSVDHASGYHLPVMETEVVNALIAGENGVYLDGTLGEGGHSLAMLRAVPEARLVVGLDLDSRSVSVAANRLFSFGARFMALKGNYADMLSLTNREGIAVVDGVLLDLGFSSRQVDQRGYGFSFQCDELLDMRYDAEQSLNASTVVNASSQSELTEIFKRLGEEPRAPALARAIVRERSIRRLNTTMELASLVERVVGRRSSRKVHPATRVFQALRIAVNGELDNLRDGLAASVELLKPGGRLAVISYHSLEDRIVKNFLARFSASCICPPGLPECVCGHSPSLEIINRRVIRPGVEEIASNPRSRSARLRLARKI